MLDASARTDEIATRREIEPSRRRYGASDREIDMLRSGRGRQRRGVQRHAPFQIGYRCAGKCEHRGTEEKSDEEPDFLLAA